MFIDFEWIICCVVCSSNYISLRYFLLVISFMKIIAYSYENVYRLFGDFTVRKNIMIVIRRLLRVYGSDFDFAEWFVLISSTCIMFKTYDFWRVFSFYVKLVLCLRLMIGVYYSWSATVAFNNLSRFFCWLKCVLVMNYYPEFHSVYYVSPFSGNIFNVIK